MDGTTIVQKRKPLKALGQRAVHQGEDDCGCVKKQEQDGGSHGQQSFMSHGKPRFHKIDQFSAPFLRSVDRNCNIIIINDVRIFLYFFSPAMR